jgi:hypothetical protein
MRKLYEATGGQPQRWESLGNLGAVKADAAGLAANRSANTNKRRPAQEGMPGRAFDPPIHPRSGRSEHGSGEKQAPV